MLIFFDGHRLIRLVVLGDELHRLRQRLDIALGGFDRGLHVVLPAAGVGAGALVGVAVVEVAGQQAAPGVGDTERAVDEYFKAHVRAALTDFFNLFQRQFARQNDALQPQLLPELHRRPVDRVGLHRQVHRQLRPALAYQHDQPWVRHDQRIWPHGDHRFKVAQVGGDLAVVGRDIAG